MFHNFLVFEISLLGFAILRSCKSTLCLCMEPPFPNLKNYVFEEVPVCLFDSFVPIYKTESYTLNVRSYLIREQSISSPLDNINPLKTKRRLFYLSPYRVVNTFHLGYKNQSVYDVSGTSRCLFSDKYKTHKYNVSRTCSC